MVGHLKDVHDIQDLETGGIIADKWRRNSSKTAWSCGFCIKLSHSLQDHLRHVGTEHFEKGQNIKNWEYSKVIQGLLLQPKIHEAWQHLLESLDPFRPSETTWNKLGTEILLYKLERGLTDHEDPQNLAKAAYDSAKYDWRPSNEDITADPTTANTMQNENQHISDFSSPPSQDRAFRLENFPAGYQKSSSPPHQVPQIPKTPLKSEDHSAYETAALGHSPAHCAPPSDQNPESDLLTSDTGDMSSTQPTTPFNDRRLHSTEPSICSTWNGYSVTPDAPHSDQEIFYHNNDHKNNWSTQFQPHTDVAKTGYTAKHPRESASPSAQALSRRNSMNDRPRKRAYRRSTEENTDRDEDIRGEKGEDEMVKDGFYD